jgi:hypothetical protein
MTGYRHFAETLISFFEKARCGPFETVERSEYLSRGKVQKITPSRLPCVDRTRAPQSVAWFGYRRWSGNPSGM